MTKPTMFAVVLAALGVFSVVNVVPAKAHQTGPHTQRYGRAWVTPSRDQVKMNLVHQLRTDEARVIYRRRVSVEWTCPDGSSPLEF